MNTIIKMLCISCLFSVVYTLPLYAKVQPGDHHQGPTSTQDSKTFAFKSQDEIWEYLEQECKAKGSECEAALDKVRILRSGGSYPVRSYEESKAFHSFQEAREFYARKKGG